MVTEHEDQLDPLSVEDYKMIITGLLESHPEGVDQTVLDEACEYVRELFLSGCMAAMIMEGKVSLKWSADLGEWLVYARDPVR